VVDEPWLYPHDPHIVAVAGDQRAETTLPQFDIDDAAAIAAFIAQHTGL
jgi:hypothetical protein